jgi:hypothetical protein
MAAAARQQVYIPLSVDYDIDMSQPIYLVDVDGTLVKGMMMLNNRLVNF